MKRATVAYRKTDCLYLVKAKLPSTKEALLSSSELPLPFYEIPSSSLTIASLLISGLWENG